MSPTESVQDFLFTAVVIMLTMHADDLLWTASEEVLQCVARAPDRTSRAPWITRRVRRAMPEWGQEIAALRRAHLKTLELRLAELDLNV